MSRGDMRFTFEQRLVALERENIVLHDTTRQLHRMLKEQRQLINDYITQAVMANNATKVQDGKGRPEEALYTFTCRQRFNSLDKAIEKLRKQVEESALEFSSA